MRYLPICTKYGQLPYYVVWIGLPYVALIAGYVYFFLSYLVTYIFFVPLLEHEVAIRLKRKRIGLTRGTRILQRAQISGVLMAFLFSVAIQKIVDIYVHPDFGSAVQVAEEIPAAE